MLSSHTISKRRILLRSKGIWSMKIWEQKRGQIHISFRAQQWFYSCVYEGICCIIDFQQDCVGPFPSAPEGGDFQSVIDCTTFSENTLLLYLINMRCGHETCFSYDMWIQVLFALSKHKMQELLGFSAIIFSLCYENLMS
jgi:hypothetical protein